MKKHLITIITALLAGYIGWLIGVYQTSPLLTSSIPLQQESDNVEDETTLELVCPEPEVIVKNDCPEPDSAPEPIAQNPTEVRPPLPRFVGEREQAPSESGYWQNQLVESSADEGKLVAIEELVLRADAEKLASGLGDPSERIRRETILGLGRIGDNQSVRYVATALFSETSTENKLAAIDVINALRYDPQADHFLRAAMEQDKDPVVRKAAAEALGELPADNND